MVHGLFRASGIVMIYRLHHDPSEGRSAVSSECLGHFCRAEAGQFWKAPKRDMVETAGALLAAGAHEDARRVLTYLQNTQRPDGHWPQNMWVNGSPYWDGIQMGETALPILLVDLAHREKALTDGDLVRFWPMCEKPRAILRATDP